MRVVDGSFTSLSVEDARELRAQGIEAWVQCLWTGNQQPSFRVANLRNALAGGLMIAGYISVTGSYDGQWHVNYGRYGVPDDIWAQLKLVFIDVELPGIPESTVRGAVDVLTEEVMGAKRRAIYTSHHAWTDLMGDPTSFTDCLLWNAYWDEDPDIDFTHLPFGGWTVDQLVGEQYTGGTDVGNVFVDLNEFNGGLFSPAEEYEMDAEIEKQLKRSMVCQRWGAMIATGDDAQVEQALREIVFVRVMAGLPPVPEAK